jgi:hypothetical protein
MELPSGAAVLPSEARMGITIIVDFHLSALSYTRVMMGMIMRETTNERSLKMRLAGDLGRVEWRMRMPRESLLGSYSKFPKLLVQPMVLLPLPGTMVLYLQAKLTKSFVSLEESQPRLILQFLTAMASKPTECTKGTPKMSP